MRQEGVKQVSSRITTAPISMAIRKWMESRGSPDMSGGAKTTIITEQKTRTTAEYLPPKMGANRTKCQVCEAVCQHHPKQNGGKCRLENRKGEDFSTRIPETKNGSKTPKLINWLIARPTKSHPKAPCRAAISELGAKEDKTALRWPETT